MEPGPNGTLLCNRTGSSQNLRDIIVAFDVNVGRLVTITRIEEEAVRPMSQNGRHRSYLTCQLRHAPLAARRPRLGG